MTLKLFLTFATLGAILVSIDASRILVFFPMDSKSHSILGHGVVRHLLNGGHEVVHVTSYPSGKPVKNLKELNVSSIAKLINEDDPIADSFKLKNLIGKGNMGLSPFFLLITHMMSEQLLGHEDMMKFFTDPKEKFDAVVLEYFFSDTIAGIANVFQCPLIWFGSTEANWQVMRLVDEIPNPSYNVDLFSEEDLPLSFIGRAKELWSLAKRVAMVELWIQRKAATLYDQTFTKIAAARGITIPSFEESVYNGSFLLLNSHPSFGTAFKLPQNAKYVGGYHVEDDVPALPEDLKKLMDNSKHGVIYFSMGSNLKSNDMSEEMKASILKTFAGFKQDVLWKFEGDLKNVPKNVKLLKWAPQQSILAHKNLKVFITHGGQLSTTEAVHHGVPLIGIPILGDQNVNMKSVAAKGFGLMIQIDENLADKMKVALDEVLGNPKYTAKAKQISMMYHDRPTKPGPELLHWVNHVIKTGGAPHLRSFAVVVPWYQKWYLDLFAAMFVGLFIIFKLLKKLCGTCFKKSEKKVKKN